MSNEKGWEMVRIDCPECGEQSAYGRHHGAPTPACNICGFVRYVDSRPTKFVGGLERPNVANTKAAFIAFAKGE